MTKHQKRNYRVLIGFIAILLQLLIITEFSYAEEKIFEGVTIDSIVIDNRNIFDLQQAKYNKFIYKTANKLHRTTQKQVIKRDVLLKVGEPYSEQLAEETARILRQRFVFFDAWIEKEILDSKKLLVRIVTIDQWSISGGVDFRLEGDEKRYKIGAKEKNLLGLNRLVSFYYFNQSNDDNYVEGSFVDKRIFGKKLMGQIAFSSNPKDKFSAVTLERPFFDLKQEFGFGIITKKKKGRIDYYTNDTLTTQSFYKGVNTEAIVLYRFGSYARKYIITTRYNYNYEKNNSDGLSNRAQDSTYNLGGIGFEYRNYDFKKQYNIDGFNYTEDYNNGFNFQIDYAQAYNIQKKNLYKMGTILFHKNFISQNQFLVLSCKFRSWYNSVLRLRDASRLNLKYYNQSVSDITFALNLDYSSDLSVNEYDLLNLGGKSGIRGTDEFLQTGDKKIILNSEIRLLPKVEIASFNIGGVLFGDFGNIIHSSEEFKISETYASVGFGIRAAFDKSSKNIIRLDFAYSRVNGWQFSFGSGQYFRASESL